MAARNTAPVRIFSSGMRLTIQGMMTRTQKAAPYMVPRMVPMAEAIGLQKTVRHGSYLVVPMIFGSVGALFGNMAVFLSNAALLGGAGMLMRKVKVTVKGPAGEAR